MTRVHHEVEKPDLHIRKSATGDFETAFNLGYEISDASEVTAVQMVVRLHPYIFETGDTYHDLQYGFRAGVDTTLTPNPAIDFSTFSTKAFIRPEDKRIIVTYLHTCIKALVKYVSPATITRITYDKNLPAKAMIKYYRVTITLSELGYIEQSHRRDEDGYDYWHLERSMSQSG